MKNYGRNGYKITSNHQVKVRVTDAEGHVINSTPIYKLNKVFEQ